MPTPAATPSRRCSASPACRRRGRAGSARRVRALFADEAAATGRRHAAAGAGLGRRPARCSRSQPVPDAGLGAADAVAVRAGGRSPTGFWIVPSWHEVPAGARRVIRLDPGLAFGTGTHPTTRMCLRWIAAHAARAGRAWRARARLRLRLGHPGHRRGAARRAATSTRSTSTRPRCRPRAANAQANGVTLRAGLPERGARPLRAGAGQHPGHAAEAAGAAAVRARCARRPAGAGRHPGAPGRRTEGGLRALAGAAGRRPRGRLDPDDRPAPGAAPRWHDPR